MYSNAEPVMYSPIMYVKATAISRQTMISTMDAHFHEHRDANPFWN